VFYALECSTGTCKVTSFPVKSEVEILSCSTI